MVVLIDWLQMPGEAESRGTALAILPERPNVRVRFTLDAEAAARVRSGLLTGEPFAYDLDESQVEEVSVEWEDEEEDEEEEDEDDDD